MKDLFQVPATIAKIETLEDKTLKLKVYTQELNEDDSAKVFRLYNKIGWFTFSQQPITEEELKDLPEVPLEKWEKTPSQRLRGVLYIFWEQNKIQETFDIFYRRKMEEWIQQIKEKLS